MNSAVSPMPLDDLQDSRVRDAVAGLTPAQLQWVSGYAAGLAAGDAPAVAERLQPAAQLTVLFGSQTGNGERVANELVAGATQQGFAARALSLAEFKPAALKRESLVTFVISTHGEGDPPDDAELFHEYLMSKKAGSLADLRFSVLALGDSSYINFCQTGREFDSRLEELGAKRFEALVECDLDYDLASIAWSARVVDRLAELLGETAERPAPRLQAVAATPLYSKENPFPAEVLVNQKITGAGSSKDVRHIELSLEDSGISYEPGDALAVVTRNPPQLVETFLSTLALDRAAHVLVDGNEQKLVDALSSSVEITVLTLGFLRDWAEASDSHTLRSIQGDDAALTAYLDQHQIIDVVRQEPADLGAQAFVDMLRKLSPRSYSIASSATENPGEVHLTVAAVRYQAFGEPHWGAASTMLADRLNEGDEVDVYVEPNTRFRLPNPDVPIIMIGPGTGVAPFRAFVEERVAVNATGSNWLFYGDRNFSSDFLYQLEWQRHLKAGHLQHLDVAFSRDQRHKVYVQDRLRARGAEVYRWVEDGAVLYVCGDASQMAADVEDALIDILAEYGDGNRADATLRLKELKRARRYQRDVY